MTENKDGGWWISNVWIFSSEMSNFWGTPCLISIFIHKMCANNFFKFIDYFVKVNQKFKAIEYLSLLLRFHQGRNVNCWKQPRLIPFFQGSLEEFKINICNKSQATNKTEVGHNDYLFQFWDVMVILASFVVDCNLTSH